MIPADISNVNNLSDFTLKVKSWMVVLVIYARLIYAKWDIN